MISSLQNPNPFLQMGSSSQEEDDLSLF
jgi:hypothetical protein